MSRQPSLGRWVGWRMSLLALGAVLAIAAGMYLWFLFGDWWVLRQVPAAARAEILQLRADPQQNEARLWELFSHYYPVRYFLPGIASRDWWVLAGLLLAAVPLILLAGFRLSRPLSSQFSAIAAAARRVASGELDTRLDVAETAPAEVRRLALDFNSLTARLQQYENDVRDSSAILAHELRTPLNAASVRVQGILDEVLPADARQLQLVKRQLDLLNTLVGDLHTLSLAEAGQLALDQRSFALAALVEERLAWFAPQLQAEGVRVELHLDECQPAVRRPGAHRPVAHHPAGKLPALWRQRRRAGDRPAGPGRRPDPGIPRPRPGYPGGRPGTGLPSLLARREFACAASGRQRLGAIHRPRHLRRPPGADPRPGAARWRGAAADRVARASRRPGVIARPIPWYSQTSIVSMAWTPRRT
ncbi:signal transduction histidine kinase [Pseudomonas psychrotolerans]|nr:signal transduction histidine kinase [Pseudomonas psychrotolerans]